MTASAFASGREFLQAAALAVAAGEQPLLLIDLIMPRIDGSGILGGLELLEQSKRFPYLAVLLMSDHPNAEAEARARNSALPRFWSNQRGGSRTPGAETADRLATILPARLDPSANREGQDGQPF